MRVPGIKATGIVLDYMGVPPWRRPVRVMCVSIGGGVRKAFTVASLCVLSQPQIFAEEGDASSLPSLGADSHEGDRTGGQAFDAVVEERERGARPQPAPESRGWVGRHPLFGALFGAGGAQASDHWWDTSSVSDSLL